MPETPFDTDTSDTPRDIGALLGLWTWRRPGDGTEFQPTGDRLVDHLTQAIRYKVGLDDPSTVTDPRMLTTMRLFGTQAADASDPPNNSKVTDLDPVTVHGPGKAQQFSRTYWGSSTLRL